MKVTTSYKVHIKEYNRCLKETVKIWRILVDFLIQIAFTEWEDILKFSDSKEKQGFVESLIHSTKQHPEVKYPDFDKTFPQLPSYLRRAAITRAIGKMSSYKTALTKSKKAGFPKAGNDFPVMYKEDCFRDDSDLGNAKIRLYDGRKWFWLPLAFRKSDIDYIHHHCQNAKRLSPTLVREGKKWSLAFPFQEYVPLKERSDDTERILAVDLGLNNPCVCSVMTSDGAVHERRFLKLPVETDHLNRSLNRIKSEQRKHHYHLPRLWAKVNGINKDIACKTARFIMNTALEYQVDTIVFEHLDTQGKKKGSKKQRLHLWNQRTVQQIVTIHARKNGIHISHVCARNSSALAFDGSGKTRRGQYIQDGQVHYNYSICTFTTGKVYNCDLNASYNIGARYFIRNILNSLPETAMSALQANYPELAKRSTSTLSTLINLNKRLSVRVSASCYA